MSQFPYNSSVQLTPHFNTKEFRCKCGGTHNILIDDKLPQMLEKLHSALKCSKIIISSGHRCAAHDKAVGGSGSGMHVSGCAADFVCYGADGKVINSKIVSCAAQDLGFAGIANIQKSYDYIHCDVRTGSKWWSDEQAENGKLKSLTNDFYTYYKLTKKDVYGETVAIKPGINENEVEVYLEINGKKYSGLLSETE